MERVGGVVVVDVAAVVGEAEGGSRVVVDDVVVVAVVVVAVEEGEGDVDGDANVNEEERNNLTFLVDEERRGGGLEEGEGVMRRLLNTQVNGSVYWSK